MSNRISHIIWFIGSFFLLPEWTSAQSFAFREYTIEDGLPSSYIYDITQDEDGFIWLATEGGVSKFDGVSFQNYPIPELGSEEVINIFFDSKGRLWMSMLNSEVAYYENGKLFRFTRDYLKGKFNIVLTKGILGMVEDEQGEIWLLSRYREAIRLDSFYQDKIIKAKVYAFTGYTQGRIMVAHDSIQYFFGDEGVTKIEGENEKLMNFNSVFQEGNHSPLYAIKKKGKIYYNTQSNIYSFDVLEENLQLEFTKYKPYLDKGINTLTYDSKGNLWVSTRDGLLFLSPKEEGGWNFIHLFKGLFIGKLFQDKDGGLWVITQKEGVFFIPSTQIKVINKAEGALPNDMITSLLLDKDGQLFVGADDNSYSIIDVELEKQKVIYQGKVMKSDQEIYDMDFDPNGELYFFTSGGLYKKTRNSHEKLNVLSYKKGEFSPSGKLWTAISSAALCGYGDRGKNLVNVRTYAIEPVSDTEAWLGTVDGLYHYSNDQTNLIGTAINENTGDTINISRIDVRSLGHSERREIWVGCKSSGLFVLKDGGIIKHLTIENGMPSNSCKHIFMDGIYAWVATNNGIAKINKIDYSIQTIDVSDGLPSREVNDILKKDSLIIVATNGGVAFFDDEIKTFSPQPNLYLKAIKINEKDTTIQSEYNLNYEQNNIKVSFSAQAYESSMKMKYSVKMEGLDKEWLESSVGKAEYPSLAPGNYQLMLKARAEDSDWSPTVVFDIFIAKPFWARIWFIILMILLGIGVFGYIIYFIVQRNKRNNAIEENLRRSRLTALRSQMNPHFMFNSLNSIQEFILSGDKRTANKYLTRFAKLMRSVLDMSDKSRITLEKEIEALKLYLELENLRFDGTMSYEINVAKEILINETTIPSMLIQPYVENAIKHGLMHKEGDKKIKINFKLEGKYLLCEVDDNGIGRETALALVQTKRKKHESKAMSVTEERLKLLNSSYKDDLDLEIIDKKNEQGESLGTKIRLYVRQKK